MKNQKIAVFISHYVFDFSLPIYGLLEYLSSLGYEIDIYLYSVRMRMNESLRFSKQSNISIYHLNEGKYDQRRLLVLVDDAHSKHNDDFKIIAWESIEKARKIAAGKSYRCSFGINPHGLILANNVCSDSRIFYYSLELFLSPETDPNATFTDYLSLLKERERYYGPRAFRTIIQDFNRAKALAEDSTIEIDSFNYLPVTTVGNSISEKSSFLHTKYNLPEHTRVLLHVGQFDPRFYCLEVAEQATLLPEGWITVMHGPCGSWNETYVEQIKTYSGNHLIVSNDLLQYDELDKLVQSADIGLALYEPCDLNCALTIKSSAKMASYLRCGLPAIVMNHSDNSKFMDAKQCGAVINEITDLPKIVTIIDSNYEQFRENALRCFDSDYNFEKSFAPILELMNEA